MTTKSATPTLLTNHADAWTRIARRLDDDGSYAAADLCDRIAAGFFGKFWGGGKDAEIAPELGENEGTEELAEFADAAKPAPAAAPDNRRPLYVPHTQRAEIERLLREQPNVLRPYRVMMVGRMGQPHVALN